jgi:hypothetical protein
VPDARPHLVDALENVLRLEYPELLGWCLAASAAVAASSDGRAAGRLVGAADATMESVGVAFGPAEQRLRGFVLSELLAQQSEAEIEELIHSGRTIDADDAVALARKYLD